MKNTETKSDLNRRDFIKGSSVTTLMALMGGVAIRAEDKPKPGEAPTEYKTTGAPLNCAVIGCGVWGREILSKLGRLPNAPIVAICDTYEPFLKRARELTPQAADFTDYRKVLEQKAVEGVFVATPSHLHREIVLAALKAGKHVYCEAPLASTVEDARVIAQAAKDAIKLNFQAGHQNRSDSQLHFLLSFIRTGAIGKTVMARSQWHKKQSWRRTSPNPEREKEINWRLQKETSPGLIGEIGVHQLDLASWIFNAPPVSVTGFGGILHWNDGRTVPDTVQAVFEYPGGAHLVYHCTLANSFDADYDMYYGTDAALMIRQSKAWMFKEVDSPLLGWEVYARKDVFYKETGIALAADSTKLSSQGNKATDESSADERLSLQSALEAFVSNSKVISTAVEDFAASFDVNDTPALKEYLATITKNKLPCAGYKEGLDAAVAALKANEAVLQGQKITFQPSWFKLA